MKHLMMFVAAMLLAGAGFSSCGNKDKGAAGCCDSLGAKTEALAFDSVVVDTATTVMNGTDTLTATVHIQLLVAHGPGAQAVNDSVLASGIFMPEFMPKTKKSLSPGQTVRAFARNFLDAYRAECDELRKADCLSGSFNYSYDVTAKVVPNEADSLTCYELSGYVYMAGAHGTSMTLTRNFNSYTGAVVDKARLIKAGGEPAVAKLICAQLQKQMGAKSLDELKEMGVFFGMDAYVPRNFVVSPDSITFIYMQDEAAPHALGEMRVTLGKRDLSAFLN